MPKPPSRSAPLYQTDSQPHEATVEQTQYTEGYPDPAYYSQQQHQHQPQQYAYSEASYPEGYSYGVSEQAHSNPRSHQQPSATAVSYGDEKKGHEGDWSCTSCGNLNFARRSTCNRCQAPRLDGSSIGGGGSANTYTSGNRGGLSSSSTIGGDDWNCPNCNNLNYARRNECNRCHTQRDVTVDKGSGSAQYGGYMEPTRPHGQDSRSGGAMSTDSTDDKSPDTIYVENLSKEVTEKDLIDFFGSIGIIKMDKKTGKPKVWLYYEKATNMPKGDATITYDDPPSSDAAINWFNGKEFKGQIISVTKAALPKGTLMYRDGGGAGSGGGGGRGRGGGGRGGGGGGPPPPRPGDWVCEGCQNQNFARRDTCYRCQAAKPAELGSASTTSSGYAGGGGSSYGGGGYRGGGQDRGGQDRGGQDRGGQDRGGQDRGGRERGGHSGRRERSPGYGSGSARGSERDRDRDRGRPY